MKTVCLRSTGHRHTPEVFCPETARDATDGRSRAFRRDIYEAFRYWLEPPPRESRPAQLVASCILQVLVESWRDVALLADLTARDLIRSDGHMRFLVDGAEAERRADILSSAGLGGSRPWRATLPTGSRRLAEYQRLTRDAVLGRLHRCADLPTSRPLVLVLGGDERLMRHLVPVIRSLSNLGGQPLVLAPVNRVFVRCQALGLAAVRLTPAFRPAREALRIVDALPIRLCMSRAHAEIARGVVRERLRRWLPRAAGVFGFVDRLAESGVSLRALHVHDFHPEATALAVAAQANGGACHAMPHGLIDFGAPEFEVMAPLSGYFTWGELDRAGLAGRNGAVAKVARAVGSPLLEVQAAGPRRRLGRVPRCVLVLFGRPDRVIQLRAFLAAVDEVEAMARARGSVTVLVKPHPADRSPFWPDRIRKAPTNMQLVSGPLEDLFRDAGVVVTMHSTAGIEAILAGLPVASIDIRAEQDCARRDPPYVTEGAAYVIDQPGGLVPVVDHVLVAGSGHDKLAASREAFLRQFLRRDDTPAADRIAHIVLSSSAE